MTVGQYKQVSGEAPKIFQFAGTPNTPYATATGASIPAAKTSPYSSFQVIATTTTGNVSATVQIQVSNDDGSGLGSGTNWLNYGAAITIASGASPQTGGFPLVAADMGATVPWRWVRANVTAITGTGAQVAVLMGY